jgi:hypothetical protein
LNRGIKGSKGGWTYAREGEADVREKNSFRGCSGGRSRSRKRLKRLKLAVVLLIDIGFDLRREGRKVFMMGGTAIIGRSMGRRKGRLLSPRSRVGIAVLG